MTPIKTHAAYTTPPELLELLQYSMSLSITEKRRVLEYMKSPNPFRDTAIINMLRNERQEFARLAKKSQSDAATVAKLRARASSEWIEITKPLEVFDPDSPENEGRYVCITPEIPKASLIFDFKTVHTLDGLKP